MDEFMKLVTTMRTAQKDYFRSRSRETLTRSKELERAVDQYIEDIDQPKLFEP